MEAGKGDMKNLMIHISLRGMFHGEYDSLVKIQIDNSLAFGWKDILLVTNFDYEYKGIKSFVVGNSNFCDFWPRTSKINVILDLFNRGMVDDLIWYHDLDAFQLRKLEPNIKGYDMGIVTYGHARKTTKAEWNSGSFFFNKGAGKIFKAIRNYVYKHKTDEEQAFIEVDKSRVKELNKTYNFGVSGFHMNKTISERPIRVAHFHPHKKNHMKLFKPLLTKRLINVFKQYEL